MFGKTRFRPKKTPAPQCIHVMPTGERCKRRTRDPSGLCSSHDKDKVRSRRRQLRPQYYYAPPLGFETVAPIAPYAAYGVPVATRPSMICGECGECTRCKGGKKRRGKYPESIAEPRLKPVGKLPARKKKAAVDGRLVEDFVPAY